MWGTMGPRLRGDDKSRLTSPRVSHRPGAGIGGGARRELAVELGEQADPVGEAILRAGGDQRGILRRGGAVDDEARARKRLEQRRHRRIAHPVVRPGHARAQREYRIGISASTRSKRAPSSLLVSVASRLVKASANPL